MNIARQLFKKKLAFVAVLSVLIIALTLPSIVYMARSYLKGDVAWNAEQETMNGITTFEPHYSAHPGHYTFLQKLQIASKLDVFAMLTKSEEEREIYAKEAATFPEAALVGEPAPDFQLQTTDGKTIRLSDKRGKITVFMFVAMTCPPARTQVPLWTELNREYDKEQVEMFFIYSRERHPGEPGYREFTHTSTFEERMNYAQMMSSLTDVPIAVDGVDEVVLSDYGMVPNAAFVVDEEGRLIFKAQWSDVKKIKVVINKLLEEKRLLNEYASATVK